MSSAWGPEYTEGLYDKPAKPMYTILYNKKGKRIGRLRVKVYRKRKPPIDKSMKVYSDTMHSIEVLVFWRWNTSPNKPEEPRLARYLFNSTISYWQIGGISGTTNVFAWMPIPTVNAPEPNLKIIKSTGK